MRLKKRILRVSVWSIIVALGGFLFGFDTAVISGAEKSIQNLFSLSNFWHGFTISIALIGTIVGALVAGKPADKYGRKLMLIIIAVLYTISAVGSALAEQWVGFMVYRFVGGLGVGASSVVAPMYISEISPAKYRGRMTALFQFNVVTGILIAFLSNYLLRDVANAWRWMIGVEAFPAFLYFVLLFIVPLSPRYLIKINKIDKAKSILKRIEGEDMDVEVKVDEIKKSLILQKDTKEKLFVKQYRKPLLVAFFVAAFNQFSGINAIMYYAPRIFEQTGLSNENSLFQPIMVGLTNMIFTLLAISVIDRMGRKKLLLIGSLGTAVFLTLIAFSFYLKNFDNYSVMFYLIGYIAFFAFSSGAVIWVLISEVFPNKVRGKGQGFGSLTHWFFAALIAWLFPYVAEHSIMGGGNTFIFFAVMMVVQFIVVWKFFPETKGVSLEDLEKQLSTK